jgi:UDP-N-acetylmuramate dehydrogenase
VIVRRNEPLARHTAWRTGGACDAFLLVPSVDDYFQAIEWCKAEELSPTVLGAGTRVVARDGGYSGAVLRLTGDFSKFELRSGLWEVGAAVPVAALSAATAAAGFTGLEDCCSHPGSFGAALSLDSGPTAGWGAVVHTVQYVFRGKEKVSTYEDFAAIKGRPVVFGATLRLEMASADAIQERMLARWRGQARVPVTPPSSWVLPPKKVSLREVLDRAGLRDIRLRDVAIPGAAPEMLVNLGGGTARDLALLHQSALERTVRECGVELQSRVTWWGRV